ncbi:MAG TPA: SlyX family protein [Arenimonas sp.]|nr:SlyX family protein [Arenimonas sp.]
MPERLPDSLEARLAELETRLTFQEQALTELGEALAESRLESTRLADRLERALADLKQLRTLLYADPGEEPPPPHY